MSQYVLMSPVESKTVLGLGSQFSWAVVRVFSSSRSNGDRPIENKKQSVIPRSLPDAFEQSVLADTLLDHDPVHDVRPTQDYTQDVRG